MQFICDGAEGMLHALHGLSVASLRGFTVHVAGK